MKRTFASEPATPRKLFRPANSLTQVVEDDLLVESDHSHLLGLGEFKSWDPQMNACVEELRTTTDLSIISMLEVTNQRFKKMNERISILEGQLSDVLGCCRKVDFCYAWIKSSQKKLEPLPLYPK